jgi:hypothetical protein
MYILDIYRGLNCLCQLVCEILNLRVTKFDIIRLSMLDLVSCAGSSLAIKLRLQ